jgi:hypothetical protein
MKKVTCLLLISLWASAGCLGDQKYGTGTGLTMPLGRYFGSDKSAQASTSAVKEQAPPKPVTPEQVTPNNARKTADALWQELDRANAEEQ